MSKSREILPETLSFSGYCDDSSDCSMKCEFGFRYFLMDGTNELVRERSVGTEPLITLSIFALSSAFGEKRKTSDDICVDFISLTNRNGILEQFLTQKRKHDKNDETKLENEYWALFENAYPRQEVYPFARLFKYKYKNKREITFSLLIGAEKNIVHKVVSLVSNEDNIATKQIILNFIRNKKRKL